MPFFRDSFLLYNWLSVFLSIADAHNTSTCVYADEKQRQLRTRGGRADDVGTPSWHQTVIPPLRKESAHPLNSHARNIPYLANPNNEFINKICLEALNGVSCSTSSCGGQVASIPIDSASSPTVDYLALFTICANHLFASPTRLSVAPHAIQNSATQVNAVVIRVMSKSSEAGASVLKLNGI